MIPFESTAIVHDWLTVPGGAEEVLRAIWEKYPAPIFTGQFSATRFPWLQGAEVRHSWISNLPLSRSKHYLYAPFLARIYQRMDLTPYDLVLVDSHSFAHHAQARKDAVHFCYYHTPARSLWSPEIDPRAGRDPIRRAIASKLKRLDLIASRNPTYIVANSKTTADRIRKIYGREPDSVVYPPVETERWSSLERVSNDGPFLMWGRLISYKRFDLAIRAAKHLDVGLDIVGAGPMRDSLERLAAGSPRIRFHGRIDDEALGRLLSKCRAVLFPGYEDFGIVPVEAMAAGVPVVAFAAGGVTETVSECHGILFPDQTVDSLCDGMNQASARTFVASALRARAKLFDRAVFDSAYWGQVEHAIARGAHIG